MRLRARGVRAWPGGTGKLPQSLAKEDDSQREAGSHKRGKREQDSGPRRNPRDEGDGERGGKEGCEREKERWRERSKAKAKTNTSKTYPEKDRKLAPYVISNHHILDSFFYCS